MGRIRRITFPAEQPAFPFLEVTQGVVEWFHGRNRRAYCELRGFRRRGRDLALGLSAARELFGQRLLTREESLRPLARAQPTFNCQLSTFNSVGGAMRTLTFLALVLAVLLTPALGQALPHAQEQAAVQKNTINLNTATIDQLMTLPGIGRKTAERIVEHRTKTGGFKKIEELMNVKGIGEKSFLKIKPLVSAPAKADKATGD